MRRADEAFQQGKRKYLEGDFLGARVDFDKAIELMLASPESAPDREMMVKKLEDMVDRIHRYDVEGLGAGDDTQVASFDKSPLEEILEMTFPVDPSIKRKVMEQVKATASQLPLEENDEVLRYVNFFSSDRGKRTMIAGLKRAGRYKEMIGRILAEEGVPQELIYLAQAESGFYPRALSYMAAAGMWQFVQFRGQEYGLKQSPYYDDRLDPEKATRAGARHLKDLYHQFGDWYLAMAAYNCGPGCVSNAVRRTGYADFWTLRRMNMLPRETTNYVPIIVAMTIMVKNAKDYGLDQIEVDPTMAYENLDVEANTSLSLIADILDVPVNDLRELNPALNSNIAPAGYTVHVPRGARQPLLAGLNAIPSEKRALWRSHRVVEGETLGSIAQRFRTSANAIVQVGREPGSDLQTGDLVIIPAEIAQPRRFASSRTPSRTAARWKAPAGKSVATRAPASKTSSSKAVKPAPRKAGPYTASRYSRNARVAAR